MMATADVTAKRQGGTIDRRRFVIRAAAVGLVTVPIGTALRTAAHEATPMGGQEMAIVTDHYALADGDAEAIWFLGTLALIKGVGSRTGGMLATVEFTHPAGFATPLHVHHLADESFYVLAGGMRGICGDQEWVATTGAFVWLPRGIPHGYAVDGDETLRTLAITVPAGFDRFIVEAGEPAQERTLPRRRRQTSRSWRQPVPSMGSRPWDRRWSSRARQLASHNRENHCLQATSIPRAENQRT